MGLSSLELEIANPTDPERRRKVMLLVDSGAVFSVVSRSILEELGIEPHDRESFALANGDRIERELGTALFFYQGRRRGCTVIFGEEGDSPLLGALTLEAFGFVLEPFRRELRPHRMLLGRVSQRRR